LTLDLDAQKGWFAGQSFITQSTLAQCFVPSHQWPQVTNPAPAPPRHFGLPRALSPTRATERRGVPRETDPGVGV